MGDPLDLRQLAKVLDELEPQSPLDNNSWTIDLAEILTDIKQDDHLQTKLREILKWIIANPRHTYPKKVKGWINTLRSQFCPRGSEPSAETLAKHMTRLEIINVYQTRKKIKRKIVYTDRAVLDRKRCYEEMSGELVEQEAKKTKTAAAMDFTLDIDISTLIKNL